MGRPQKSVEHGTVSGYSHYGCKCQDCRDAYAAYRRKLRGRETRVCQENGCERRWYARGMCHWHYARDRGYPVTRGDGSTTVGQIYAVQEEDDGPIKIGFSVDADIRLLSLQCGNPRLLNELGRLGGERRDETKIHSRLASHRIRGEWFRPHQEVLDLVAGWRNRTP